MANTILLKGRGIRKEGIAGGAITPGHLLTINTSGNLIVHATQGGDVAALFAVENDIVGKEITDAYASGDYVQAEYLYTGCEVLAIVAAGEEAIVIGDLLTSKGDGTLEKIGEGDVGIAQALEAVDNSGSAAIARIRAVII